MPLANLPLEIQRFDYYLQWRDPWRHRDVSTNHIDWLVVTSSLIIDQSRNVVDEGINEGINDINDLEGINDLEFCQ